MIPSHEPDRQKLRRMLDGAEAENARLRKDATRLDWLSRLIVEVREPLLHGSREVLHGVPGGDEETTMDEPWDLRGAIDKAMKPKRNRRLSDTNKE